MINRNQTQTGFALLMTLIVVSVMVVITASIIELSRKQLALSVTARDSEIAFQAANAGAECVRYIQRVASSTLESGGTPIDINCFGTTNTDLTVGTPAGVSLSRTGADYAQRRYTNSSGTTWNGDRCTQIDLYIATVDVDAANNQSITGLNNLYPGYPSSPAKTCQVGSVCYVAAISGYNKPCNALTGTDTVRREVLLEF